MKKTNKAIVLLTLFATGATPLFSQNETFTMRQVVCALSQPWEITYGPDNWLWVTEAHNYQVSRINPVSGEQNVLLDLSARKNFPNNFTPFPQGGLMGLALHPQFNEKPYVYLAYVYRFDTCLSGNQGCFFKTKVVRYTYSTQGDSLFSEQILCDTIPGSSDHNGGRMVIGLADNNYYLFYSVGDMAAGHLGNRDRPNQAQDQNKYEGKILRFSLEPDDDAGLFDRWIPEDNPFNLLPDTQSAVWTLGHRNPQGLVFGENNILYEAEHGPYSDDELIILVAGGNYGHPLVSGFADGNYDGSAVGAGSGVPIIDSEAANAASLTSYHDPIETFFPAGMDTVSAIYNNDKNNTPPFPNYYLSWPTMAPSGIDYYNSAGIPGWDNSILLASLKLATMYRVKLSAGGEAVSSDTIPYFAGMGRFRDIAISPDGKKIYLACDSVGQIKGPENGTALPPPNRGCILEFTYATTAVSDPPAEAFRLFPNPASQTLTLDLNRLPAGPLRIRAFNYLGTLVYDRELEKQPQAPLTLDVSSWPEGQYVLSVQPGGAEQRQFRQKVTVARGN